LKKIYEKPLDGANPKDSFSNTLINSQFEKSLEAMSNHEFHNETKMIDPIRYTLESLKNQLLTLDERNKELEGGAKCWQDKAKSNCWIFLCTLKWKIFIIFPTEFQEKNDMLTFELSAASLQDNGNCEMCQEMYQCWQKNVASHSRMKNEVIVGVQELVRHLFCVANFVIFGFSYCNCRNYI
jgi:hypothetical protein